MYGTVNNWLLLYSCGWKNAGDIIEVLGINDVLSVMKHDYKKDVPWYKL